MTKDLETNIKSIFSSILGSRNEELLNENKKEFLEICKNINLKDPELFFFKYNYDRNDLIELAVEHKAKESGIQLSHYFTKIYLNYSDIEHYIKGIIKKEQGYVCCADKARNIVTKVLQLEMNISKTLQTGNKQKSFADPFYRNLSKWRQLIQTCPLVNTNKAEEHMKVLSEILSEMRKAKEKKEKFVNSLSEWLLASNYKSLQCQMRDDKSMTYEEMFNSDKFGAYEWLKAKNPEIIHIYKKR